MHLYFKPAACSLGVRIVLTELDMPHDTTLVDTDKGRTASGADYLKINPRGYVPALVLDDGTVLTENLAILQYLADQHGQAGMSPEHGSIERARLQEALSFISSELHKAFSPFFHNGPLSPTAREAAETRLARRIGDIEHYLSDGRTYLLGDNFSVADAYLFVVLNWAKFIRYDLKRWPKTSAYLAHMAKRPSVRRALQAEGLLGEVAA